MITEENLLEVDRAMRDICDEDVCLQQHVIVAIYYKIMMLTARLPGNHAKELLVREGGLMHRLVLSLMKQYLKKEHIMYD